MSCSLRVHAHLRNISFIGWTMAVVMIVVIGCSKGEAAVQALEGPDFYQQRILPVFETQCLMCHRGEARKGGLDMTSRDALLKGGNKGPAIQPGNAKESLLYKLVAHEQEPAMPYRMDKLSPETIALFAVWINAGAPFDKPVAAYSPAPGKTGDGIALFTRKVKPILENQCMRGRKFLDMLEDGTGRGNKAQR